MPFQTVYTWTTDDDKSFPNVTAEADAKVAQARGGSGEGGEVRVWKPEVK